MKDLLEQQRQKRKISDIVKENSEVWSTKEVDSPSPVKNVLGGLFSGLATTPLGVIGMAEAIPTASYNLTKAAIDENYDVKDALIDTVSENKSFQAASFVDDKIRDVMGLKRYEDLSGGEQLASLTGELIPTIATGGAYGVVKLGNKAAQKAAIKALKKKAVKSGKALTSSAIQSAKNKADSAVNMLLPGVQVTKGASTSQKATEIGLQAGIPLAINEAVRYGADQEGIFGDYSPKENTLNMSLISDKRKIKGKTYVDELAPGVISDYTLDIKAQLEKEKAENIKTTALVAGGILGSVAAGRKLRSLFNKEINSLSDSFVKNDGAIDALDAKTRADMTIADRFAYKKSYVDKDLLSEETANRLTQDVGSKINKAFKTGDLYDGITLPFTPQSTYVKLNTLRLQNPVSYQNIEDYLEICSNLQDETHRFNKTLDDVVELSPEEYIKRRNYNKNEAIGNTFTDLKALNQNIKRQRKLLQQINNDPVTKQILSEISQIGEALLKKMEVSGMWSQQQINSLRKNRTIGNIFTYKPRVLKTEPTLKQRLWHYLFEKNPTDNISGKDILVRGDEPVKNTYNYLDVFEKNFKQTLQDIEDNNIKKITIREMEGKTFDKINNVLDEFEANYDKPIEELQKFSSIERKALKDIDNFFVVKPLGSKNVMNSISKADKSFYDILNRKRIDGSLAKSLDKHNQSLTKLDEALKDNKHTISFIENGEEKFYKVNEYVKRSFDLNPTLPNMLKYHMRSLKNLVQNTITGKLNPAFSIPSAVMSSHEALTLLPKLANELAISPDKLSRWSYIKEFKNAYNDLYTSKTIEQTLNQYDKLIIKGMEDSSIAQKLAGINVEELRAELNSKLLTQLQKQGGASSKPLNTNSQSFYNLKHNTVISDKIEKFLLQHDGLDAAVQKLNLINFLQGTIRETPSLALSRYLGKQTGAIVDNQIVDLKKMQKVIDTIGTYTANVGRSGISTGTLGAFFRGVENYVPYGNVMIKSLAPKIRSSGISTGIDNVIKTVDDLYNPKVRYIDILRKMHQHSKDLAKNKFVEGLIVTSMMPSLIQYVWNHGSEENRQAYYQLSDYDKASKFILVNFFGNGRPLSLAKDQEVALADSIFTTLLDGVVGMSRYNNTDPAFKQSKLIMQSLSRSIGIDSVPLVDIVANTQGYDVNFNIFGDKPIVSSLSRNKINPDMSETAYENGLVNQETTALVNSLFGIVGSTLLGSFEEANVGARNDTGLLDFGQRMYEGITKSARLAGKKHISSYNETSKEVYKKQNLINKIASVSEKTPVQEQVYETVKLYNRNRIKPVHDMITDLRKSINTVRANGRMPDGTVLDFNGRRAKISEMNEELQVLFAHEYNEFRNLDNLLEQMYGNGITLDNFMEKLQ